jgi:uncharacterized membrane protein YfcA
MRMDQWIIAALIGAGAGLLGGLLGLGGAIVIVPALVFFLGYSQPQAQGTALMMMVLPTGALAAWEYHRNGFVELKVSLIMAAFFFVAGYFGARLATHVPQILLKKIFAAMLLLLAIRIWVGAKPA